MLPNNNFSPLPWYRSQIEQGVDINQATQKALAQQNARKWWVFNKVYPLYANGAYIMPFQIQLPYVSGRDVASAQFELWTAEGEYVNDVNIGSTTGLRLYTNLDGCDYYVWNGTSNILGSIPNGRYYLRFYDNEDDICCSEIFTVVNDIQPYLRLEWFDQQDLVMDAGRIIYQGGYTNVLYLQADLAKPEYLFTEEGEERDGYFYPLKQISEKRYHFKFWASEYLLDVLRFVRMSDYVKVVYRGKEYPVDTFLLTPEWEDAGDIASVTAEFDTATVAKKLDVGYIRNLRGDFNDDYNDDYSNQQ